MKIVCREKSNKILLIFLLVCSYSLAFSQSDSAAYWKNKINACNTISDAKNLSEQLRFYFDRSDKQSILYDALVILPAASQNRYAKILFHDLFIHINSLAKAKNLETEFSLFAIKLESNPLISSTAKNQLYYYYTLLYFQLKEYYYADKYCDLFLKKGLTDFEEDVRTNYSLNAMTISALIDIEKNELFSAYKKLKVTLDSSIAKKSTPWIGITKGNIGEIYFRLGKYDSAITHLNEDIRISLASNEFGSAINSYIELFDIYSRLNKNEISNLYIDSAYNYLNKILENNQSFEKDFINESIKINSVLAKRFNDSHDFQNASKFYAKAFELQILKDKNEKENQLKRIIQRNEIDRNLNKINELHEELDNKKTISFYFQVIIIAIIGILIFYISFYLRSKRANKALIEKNEIIHQQNLELEKTNNDKDRLFSIISHDLRGPAKNLDLIFNAIVDKKISFQALESQIPSIKKNTSNLVNALESLLNWSAAQLKGIKANKVVLDIQQAVEKNILFFEDNATKKNIKLINHCPSTMVRFDKNHLDIILRNFTSNAIKFSNQYSNIQYFFNDMGDYWELSISDEGMGITEDQIGNILNSISSKSTVGTIGEKGIGLGLLLTKEFIEINGGILKICSEWGKGTTMIFTIPKNL